jgi:hypothetical protein
MAKKAVSKDEILNAIRLVASESGKPPSRSAFIGHTGISEYHVLKHFPSWNNAVEAAGLEPDTTNVPIKDDDLLADWARLVRELRQIPTRVQYRHYGNFCTGVFEHHFGPWSCLPDRFRSFAGDRDEWKDVLTLLPLKKSDTTDIGAISEKKAGVKSVSPLSPLARNHSRLDDRPI